MTEATAGIGHNLSPFHATSRHIQDLFDEAKHWLDGGTVTDKKTADGLNKLIGELRKAKTACDDARKDEVVYWNDGKKEVQDRFNPFLKMAKQAIDTAQKALGPWLLAQDAAKREEMARQAAEANTAMTKAVENIRASSGNLEQRQEAEKEYEDAQELEKIAKKTARQNIAKGAQDRWDTKLENRVIAAQYFWSLYPEDFDELLEGLARGLVDKGKHEIPGFLITQRIVV